ncbi:MAG: hypothetical protein PHX50_17100 [Massilibacteroides sp.]|nr:hypothetical protein [Massilibacteroides sp.]MDD3064505.1 hypothetical protein [Massilibacteroides sp.]
MQDRLNPESTVYYGEAYTNDIEVLFLYNGKRFTLSELWPYLYNGNAILPEEYLGVQAPKRETADYGLIDQNTLGYYFLYVTPQYNTDDNLAFVYIRYPDGKEDEIKIEIFRNKEETVTLLDKIWVNNELIYSKSENFYNSDYYPWLEPVLDDNDKQIKNLVQPVNGTSVIALKK